MLEQVRFIRKDPSSDCAIWHMAVAEAFCQLMTQVFGMDLLEAAREVNGGPDIDKNAVFGLGKDRLHSLRQEIMLGFVRNMEASQALLDTITKRFCVPVPDPSDILNGPSKDALAAQGIIDPNSVSPELKELLEALGARTIEEEGVPPGTKVN